MPVVSIRHLTRYRYRNPVGFGEHRMMFRPREGHGQRVISAELVVDPIPSRLRLLHDPFGNAIEAARFDARARTLSFLSRVTVDHRPGAPFEHLDPEHTCWSAHEAFVYDPEEHPDLAPSIARAHGDVADAVAHWARRFVRPTGRTPLPDLLTDMCHAIRADFSYGTRLERGVQTPAETLGRRGGACRDYALLMMEAARSLGLAARFSSGYVYNVARGPRRKGRIGGGHTHGWASIYVPGCGWVPFDPTNGLVGGIDLIEVAQVRDPIQATVLHGSWDGEKGDFLGMDVEVDVRAEAGGTSAQPSGREVVAVA